MSTLHQINERIRTFEQAIRTTQKPSPGPLKVGVDLGTAYIVLVVLDQQDKPVCCELQAADVLRDGVVVDFFGAQSIVRTLKEKAEKRLGQTLERCAIAMPPGTDSSEKTHLYVVEGAGLDVVRVLDEPTAANSVLNIQDGVIIDIGGGTTGMAVVRDGVVVDVADEPTGGTHLSLVIAGNRKISFAEAEKMKQSPKHQKEMLPVVRPVMEKMATIVQRRVKLQPNDVLYLVGGTCCYRGIERVFADVTGLEIIKPENPLWITPAGIAING